MAKYNEVFFFGHSV